MDKPKVKKPKAKAKAKAKPKAKPTQTQTQKVILNLSDVLKKKPSRRTPAKPRQPQIVYQQAPQALQPDIASIIREQLSGMSKPVLKRSDNIQTVEQPKQNLVQTEQPIISITEPVKSLKPNPLLSMFRMKPTQVDRPIQLEEPDEPEEKQPVISKPIQLEEEQEQVRALFEKLEEQTKPKKGKGSREPRSQETKEKISTSKKGIPRSEEEKAKISVAKKGIPRSEEERLSISEGLSAYHAGKKPFIK